MPRKISMNLWEDIVASTSPSYIPVWVLVEKTYTVSTYQEVRREVEGAMYPSREEASRAWQEMTENPRLRFDPDTLVINKRDLRFGEGDYG